jgi:hypothetical protein
MAAMAVMTRTQQRQLVTRNMLLVVCEGMPRGVVPGPQAVTFGEGCMGLRCQGSEMTASVDLERHDVEPDMTGEPWQVAAEGLWTLTSGHLGVNDLEGLLDWFPDVRLGAWNTRVSTCGGQEAADLEDRLFEEESEEWTDGPERFLVQLWPHE